MQPTNGQAVNNSDVVNKANDDLVYWQARYDLVEEYLATRKDHNRYPKMHIIMRRIQTMWNAGRSANALARWLYLKFIGCDPVNADPYAILKVLRINYPEYSLFATLFSLRNATTHMNYKQLTVNLLQTMTKNIICLIGTDYKMVKRLLFDWKDVYSELCSQFELLSQSTDNLPRIGTLKELRQYWCQLIKQRKIKLLDRGDKIVTVYAWNGTRVKVFNGSVVTQIPVDSRVEIL